MKTPVIVRLTLAFAMGFFTLHCTRAQDPGAQLTDAVIQGDLASVERLIASGAGLETLDSEGKTPLMNAVYYKHPGVTAFLLGKGADVNAKEPNGWSPLMLASMAGDSEIVKMLIDAGADVNIKTNDGETPLMRAQKLDAAGIRGDYEEIITLLKEAGAE
jgi:ankyrin repeat protein